MAVKGCVVVGLPGAVALHLAHKDSKTQGVITTVINQYFNLINYVIVIFDGEFLLQNYELMFKKYF